MVPVAVKFAVPPTDTDCVAGLTAMELTEVLFVQPETARATPATSNPLKQAR
jgi:hypothetical protein